jgi:hypothetical protein
LQAGFSLATPSEGAGNLARWRSLLTGVAQLAVQDIVAAHVDPLLLHQAQSYLSHRGSDPTVANALEVAWGSFYDLCSRKIRKFAFSCWVPEEDVADCIQDVWAELLLRLPTFHPRHV